MMKKKITFLCGALVAALMCACEQELPLYSDTQAYLNFNNNGGVTNYSFVFSGGKTTDTVWVNLTTTGMLADHDRSFVLRQVITGRGDAVPGTHYQPLDAETLQRFMVVPAGSAQARVPVVVYKDESLNDTTLFIMLEVVDNGTFRPGFKEQLTKIVSVTNQLTKPTRWDDAMDYYLGRWGRVKHQFMIDNTGENWDDEFIKSIINDMGLIDFYRSKLTRALDAENARRAEAGLPLLQEKDGTLVSYDFGM